jgi:hypothetical protein
MVVGFVAGRGCASGENEEPPKKKELSEDTRAGSRVVEIDLVAQVTALCQPCQPSLSPALRPPVQKAKCAARAFVTWTRQIGKMRDGRRSGMPKRRTVVSKLAGEPNWEVAKQKRDEVRL